MPKHHTSSTLLPSHSASDPSERYVGFTCPMALGACKDVTLDWSDAYEDYYLETSKEVRPLTMVLCHSIMMKSVIRSNRLLYAVESLFRFPSLPWDVSLCESCWSIPSSVSTKATIHQTETKQTKSFERKH